MLTLLNLYFISDYIENWLLTFASSLAIFALGTLTLLESLDALFKNYKLYLVKRRKLAYCEIVQAVRE